VHFYKHRLSGFTTNQNEWLRAPDERRVFFLLYFFLKKICSVTFVLPCDLVAALYVQVTNMPRINAIRDNQNAYVESLGADQEKVEQKSGIPITVFVRLAATNKVVCTNVVCTYSLRFSGTLS
jgi:hypothetical protein